MNELLKSLGVILVAIGALMMIIATATGSDLLDQNWYTLSAMGLTIVGLLAHIFLNKMIKD